MKATKTILVTGGAGFVGSNLCKRLRDEGHRVISLDNYFAGSKDNHVPGVDYREGHTKDIGKHVPEAVDLVYHLGEYSRVEQSVLEPDVVYDLNTLGTRGVVEYWRARKVKLVYAGSSTKFGDKGAARHTSPYAKTKAENSELVRDIGEREGLPYAVTYFYNVYGPGERAGIYGTVIEQFKRMYLSGAPCAIVKPGTQERNFTHVDDIVDGLVRVGESGQGDEYGLGNEKAYSIFEVAELFGFGDDIVLFPPRQGNRMTSGLDTRKSHALGWKAERALPDYIRAFTSGNPRGAHREKRVLVFSTTMHPIAGLTEDAFVVLAQEMPDVMFDVITTKFSAEAARAAPPAPNMRLYRVGFGTSFDKFLLPILGTAKAFSLRKERYLFAWSLLASYAALAALFFKNLSGGMPLLITLGDQNLDDLGFLKRSFLSLAISHADQVYGTHGAQEGHAQRVVGQRLPRNTLGEGESFANALRYAYADVVRRLEKEVEEHDPRHILIFSLAYYPHVGGAEVSIKEITDRLPHMRFSMITLRFGNEPRRERIGNVEVYRVGFGSAYLSKVLFVPLAALKARALQKKERFDGAWAMMTYMTLPLVLLRLLGVRLPYVLNLQDGDPFERVFKRWFILPLRPLLDSGIRRAAVVQVLSNYLAGWARRAGYRGDIEVIPNGADTERFASAKPIDIGKQSGETWLVTSSRLVHKNAVDDVIRALALLPESVKFLILGTGADEGALRALAKERGVEARAIFKGYVSHAELPEYLKACDIFIRPSRTEGFGASFVEAFAAGIPVVATKEGGLADFLFDARLDPGIPPTGFAVSKDAPEEIAEAVKRIMEHPEEARKTAENARELAFAKYDWKAIADAMEANVFPRLTGATLGSTRAS